MECLCLEWSGGFLYSESRRGAMIGEVSKIKQRNSKSEHQVRRAFPCNSVNRPSKNHAVKTGKNAIDFVLMPNKRSFILLTLEVSPENQHFLEVDDFQLTAGLQNAGSDLGLWLRPKAAVGIYFGTSARCACTPLNLYPTVAFGRDQSKLRNT